MKQIIRIEKMTGYDTVIKAIWEDGKVIEDIYLHMPFEVAARRLGLKVASDKRRAVKLNKLDI